MPKINGPFWVYKHPKTKKFQITLYPASGLPPEICENWQRKGFSRLPLELAVFREPKTKAAAESGAMALIEYLKNQLKTPQHDSAKTNVETADKSPTVGEWLLKFISLDNNPRSARLMGEGSPYSIETIELYRLKYNRYIKGDPLRYIGDMLGHASLNHRRVSAHRQRGDKRHGGEN
jgi:hypothetical protein